MNTNSELERIVSDWLEDRVAAPPHKSLRAALARADQTPQLRHRWLPRWFGRGRGPTGGAAAPDRDEPTNDRRNRSVISIAAVAAGAASLAFAVTLLVPRSADGPVPVPGAAGPTHRVAADGSADFTTITEALAAAEEGDTILVAPGIYAEYLLIDKDITLAGDGPREEIVVEFPEGGPTHYFLESDFSFPMVLQGSDATVRGLSVHVPLAGGGILVQGGAPELTDLSVLPHPDATVVVFPHPHPSAGLTFGFENGASPVLRDSTWTGHLYSGGSSPTIEDNTITSGQLAMDGPGEAIVRGNTFLDGAVLLPDADLTGAIEGNDLGTGLILVGPGSMTVQGNEIRGLRSIQYGEAAIRVEDGSSTRILGNRVADSDGGIQVEQGAVATIEGNQLTDNDVAILWQSSEAGAIGGNSVSGGERGIVITDGDPLVVDNTVCGSGSNLVISEQADPRLGENDICADEVASPE